MKINYINQLQRDILLGNSGGMSLNTIQSNGKTVKENINHYFDNKTPDEIVEDMGLNNTPILEDISMEDAAKEHSQKVWGEYRYDVFKHDDIITDESLGEITQYDFIAGWQQREQQLLPIIKELLEALKRSNTIDLFLNNNKQHKQNLITLEKYKNYL